MKRIDLKLTGAIVGLLVLASMATTATVQDLNALASRGETLARADPLSAELRNREPNSQSRRGFCIGMAAAEGHTAPGPGKDKTRALLSAMERNGFDRGVLFSLERNRYVDLARIGAAIAKTNPDIAAARTADTDVFFWLGFDIATGIFGDPKLGALGNTATGPGSLGRRDTLCAAGQRGFNASVKLLVKPVPVPGKLDPNAIATPVGDPSNNRVIKEILKAPFISAVQVVPDSRSVVISFASTQSTPPLIEIGKVAPETKRGVVSFPFDSGAFSRFAPEKKGRYSLDVDVQQEQLDIGTTYYYIINVFNDNKNDAKRPREQVSGKFTTTPQRVEIMWDTILVEDDSDEQSTGEAVFGFFANYKQPSAQYAVYSNQDIDSGHNYYPDKSSVIENAPDRLSLAVRGQEDDGWGKPYTGLIEREPCSGPADTIFPTFFDVNGAEGVFDLSQYPGTNVSIPFRLNSMPHGALKFAIFGRIVITRRP